MEEISQWVMSQKSSRFVGFPYRKAMQLLGFSFCAIEPERRMRLQMDEFGQ
jgi:hypothetical protein